MNGRCYTCKHWEHPPTLNVLHGICHKADDVNQTENDSAFADANYFHDAFLKTAPLFGCVQFEPKE